MVERNFRLHFSKKNDEIGGGKGTNTISVDGVTHKFNHWGVVLEERNWAGCSVESSLDSARPENPDSYEHVADVPESVFFQQCGLNV